MILPRLCTSNAQEKGGRSPHGKSLTLTKPGPLRYQHPCDIETRTVWPVMKAFHGANHDGPLIGKVEPGLRVPATWNQTFFILRKMQAHLEQANPRCVTGGKCDNQFSCLRVRHISMMVSKHPADVRQNTTIRGASQPTPGRFFWKSRRGALMVGSRVAPGKSHGDCEGGRELTCHRAVETSSCRHPGPALRLPVNR
jgi:hypothetical protein